MAELSQSEVRRIAKELAPELAPLIVSKVREEGHEFWIDGEQHYNDHMQARRLFKVFDDDMIALLKDMAKTYRVGRGTFVRAFLALFVMGILAISFFGLWSSSGKGN